MWLKKIYYYTYNELTLDDWPQHRRSWLDIGIYHKSIDISKFRVHLVGKLLLNDIHYHWYSQVLMVFRIMTAMDSKHMNLYSDMLDFHWHLIDTLRSYHKQLLSMDSNIL